MPKEVFGRNFHFLPQDQLLTFEEIETLSLAFHAMGVRKLRLTGGEPLVIVRSVSGSADNLAIRRSI